MIWKILSKKGGQSIEELLEILLKNRNITGQKRVDFFLKSPDILLISSQKVGIDKKQVKIALERIKKAIKEKENIFIYGDYDADGISATAIVWEVLYKLKAKVFPFIPSRVEEGYGLSRKGIDKIRKDYNLSKEKSLSKSLIITVDNGIVAHEAIEYAKKNNFDVIITDHHSVTQKLPKSLAIIHTTQLSGAGVAWFFIKEILEHLDKSKVINPKDCLDLAAIGSISDLVPLTDYNRIIVKHGLDQLNVTKRVGLIELISDSGLNLGLLGNYEVGFILAPRLNAVGRLEHGLDSLRLLCTTNKIRAIDLARKLGLKNRERQELTGETVKKAKEMVEKEKKTNDRLIFVSNKDFNQGIIGLVAGKLVEEYYLPAIVVSLGEKISKGSARSINGINIISLIRSSSRLLIDCGGHPMAAGFTVKNEFIKDLKLALEKEAKKLIGQILPEKELKIDCPLPLGKISSSLFEKIQSLSPFGIGNPEPVFICQNVRIREMKLVGQKNQHLKLKLDDFFTKKKENVSGYFPLNFLDGIGFNLAVLQKNLNAGDIVDIVYCLSQNVWNGRRKIEMKIKDIRKTQESKLKN